MITTAARQPFGQFAKFLLVGLGNTCVSFAVYRLLIELRTPYVAAAALAFTAGAANGYIFNRRWTFGGAANSSRARAVYVAVQAGGLASNSFLVWVLGDGGGISPVSAYLAALPPVTIGMFLANRFWTFTDPGGSWNIVTTASEQVLADTRNAEAIRRALSRSAADIAAIPENRPVACPHFSQPAAEPPSATSSTR